MLIYHPAQDAYHCVFRMLVMLEKVNEIEVDKARILDFYLAFPTALYKIRWPANMRPAKTASKSQENPYRNPISPTATFRSMHQLQSAALRCIAASNLIDAPSLENNMVRRTETPVSVELQRRIDFFFEKNNTVADLVVGHLSSIDLLGRDGLKARTELMEFRYDPA